MPLQILPLLESDIPIFVHIELEAFRSHPRIPMLWPNGYTPDLYAFYESSKTKHFHDENGRMIKAVDEATGEIKGCAQFTFRQDDGEEVGDDERPENWPEGGNWEMRKWYARNSREMIRETFGRGKYLLVDFLVVEPKYHGQGIGSQLLAYGIKEADAKGLPLGLESTPAGLALYKRYGFEEVKTIKADMRLFGWEKPYDEEAAKRVWMVRQPKMSG